MELLLTDTPSITATIDKLVAFAEAGADVLFAPGVSEKSDVQAMVRTVRSKSLNVMVMRPDISVAELADLDVRRIYVGAGSAQAAWKGLIEIAK